MPSTSPARSSNETSREARHGVPLGRCRELAHAQANVALRRAFSGRVQAPSSLAAHHVADELACAKRRRSGVVMMLLPSRSTVTRSARREDLVEPVRDVDASPRRRARSSRKTSEQVLDLAVAERRGGLVEDEQLARACEGPGDLDELALPDAEFGHGRRRFEIEADACRATCARASWSAGQSMKTPRLARRLVTEKQVLGHGHLVDERELLMDDGNAGARRHRARRGNAAFAPAKNTSPS